MLKDGDKRAAYDRFGHAAFEHGGGGAAHGFGADFATSFADIFEDLFGMAGGRRGGGGRGQGRERGSDLRYNMEITLEEAFVGKTAQIRIPTSVICEACSGSGAKAGTKPKVCADLRRRRQDPPRPRLFHARAHLPDLSGPRPGDRRSLPVLRRRRPRHARAHAVGQYPARRRRWHPHPSRRRRRGGSARRAGRRSLYFPLDRAARAVPARRRRSALPRADFHGDGGLGRRIRGAGDRRRQSQGESARPARRPAAVSG